MAFQPQNATQFQFGVGSVIGYPLPANGNRKLAEFQNQSDTMLWLALGAAATANVGAIGLTPSGGVRTTYQTSYVGTITAFCVAASGGKNMGVTEQW